MQTVSCRPHSRVLVMPKSSWIGSKIFDTLHMAYNFVANPHPLSALFGIPHSDILTAEAQHSMAFCTLLARCLILLNWKQALPPSYDRWVKEVLYNLKLERLRFSLRCSLRKFDEIWNPLPSIIDSLDIIPDESDIWVLRIYSVTTYQSVFIYLFIFICFSSLIYLSLCIYFICLLLGLVFLIFHIMCLDVTCELSSPLKLRDSYVNTTWDEMRMNGVYGIL